MYLLVYMSTLASNFKWHGTGNFAIQLAIFTVTTTFLFLLYSIDRKITYWFVVVFFLSNTVRTLVMIHDEQMNISSVNITSPRIYSYLVGKQIKSTPDIFLLIYDSYPNEETMLHYGIDNGEQIQFLKEIGFTLYPRTYSVGAASLSSMSRVLHVNKDLHGNIRNYTAGDNSVCNILKSAGYKTIGIFSTNYFFQGDIIPSYRMKKRWKLTPTIQLY